MSSIFYTKRLKNQTRPTKKTGARTFKSEEAAKKYAEEQGIKEYELMNLHEFSTTKKPKIKIVAK